MDRDGVALVLGGSRGIGAAIVRRLTATGRQVVFTYLSSDALAQELGEAGPRDRVRGLRVDVRDRAAMEEALASVRSANGPIAAVIHCATPRLPDVGAASMERGDLRVYLETYVESSVDIVRLVVPEMTERAHGRFVFLGTSAMYGTPPSGWAPYLIAKYAQLGLARSLAAELGPSGITTNVIVPGLAVTDLTAGVSARAKEVEARRAPMRRLVEPGEIAALVEFLIGPDGGFVNGAVLPLTGGPI